MTDANPVRHRERLVLSLDDEGLEDLTLRVVLPDHPKAHRTYRGADGGVDVFSDYDLPPKRAWQCKNYADGGVDWAKCRGSLKTAMREQHPPLHYTYVFPRLLKKSDHDYWRATFIRWAQAEFGDELPVLDYWDDLAHRLQERPDLVDLLDDGALGGYTRRVLTQTAADGVNPLATASDHVDDPAKVAERAKQIGKTDPYFAYGQSGREAGAADRDLPPDRPRFSLDRSDEEALPRYSLAVRRGDEIHEITAAPREGTQLRPARVVFTQDAEGIELRERTRRQLAKGRPVTLNNSRAHLDPGEVPDKFRQLTNADGRLSGGELALGVSKPLTLVIRLAVGNATVYERVPLYRIPEQPGGRTAWGGSIGGTILTVDLRPVIDEGDKAKDDVEFIFGVVSGFDGESPDEALHGLGFVRAFAQAESAHFECKGLLKPGGITIDGPGDTDPIAQESLQATGLVAQALAELEKRDRRGRTMPTSIDRRDATVADLIVEIFRDGEIRDTEASPRFEVPLPETAQPGGDASQWASFVQPLPAIAGRPTLRVRVDLENATPLRVTDADDGQRVLLCQNDGAACVVMRPHDFATDEAPPTGED